MVVPLLLLGLVVGVAMFSLPSMQWVAEVSMLPVLAIPLVKVLSVVELIMVLLVVLLVSGPEIVMFPARLIRVIVLLTSRLVVVVPVVVLAGSPVRLLLCESVFLWALSSRAVAMVVI